MKLNQTILPLSLSLLLAACSSSGDDAGSGPTSGTGGGTGPELFAGDLPSIAPCPDQAYLTDAALIAEYKTALVQGSYLYLDVPFDGADPDIFTKKCGLGAFWDPAANTDEIPPSVPPYQDPALLSDFFVFGNAGICAADYAMTFAPGLPVAGVYRKEFKVSHLGVSYHTRMRVTVSGAAAGASFTSLSIAVPADLQNTVGYTVNGTASTHANVLTDIANALAVPSASATLEVLDAPGGNVLVTVLVEFLCVEAM